MHKQSKKMDCSYTYYYYYYHYHYHYHHHYHYYGNVKASRFHLDYK